MLFNRATIIRFIRYSAVGTSTFAIDLSIVYLLNTFTSIPDLAAIAAGFLSALSINFVISYIWVFKGTTRTLWRGYSYFFLIGLGGLLLVLGSTSIIMAVLAVPLVTARILGAGLIGTLNFFANDQFNFKMK